MLRLIKNEIRYIRKDWLLYVLVVPGILFFIIFRYLPMYGITIAFRDYSIFKGFSDAPFIGFSVFEKLFSYSAFRRAFGNTVIISVLKLIFSFPAPILLSLLINEVTHVRYKKSVQTALLLPHFVSWVVISGIFYALFSPSSGVIGGLLKQAGYMGEIVNFMGDKRYFRAFLVTTDIWKGMGYGTIVYLSAIVGIDQQLYEAAKIDGAGKFSQIYHITLPSIRTVIVLMLIMQVGTIMDAGFDQIFNLYNPLVTEVSEIIDTYVYKIGIVQRNYTVATAAGLLKSTIGLVLVLSTNAIARRVDEDSALL